VEHLVKARVLIAELAREGLIEARRADAVGRDLAALVDRLGRVPTGLELEEHRLVTEVFAGPDALDAALDRHLGAAFAPPTQMLKEARHPELEAQIRQDPGSVEHYLVYSDWLQERSDPLGELIALGVAAESGEAGDVARFERLLKQHEERFLGPLARLAPEQVALTWRFGFVEAIDAHDVLEPGTWEQLLGLRVCELVRSIKLSLHHEPEPALAALTAIGACAPGALRSLFLRGYDLALPPALLGRPLEELALQGERASLPEALPASLVRLRLRLRDVAAPAPPRRWDIHELDINLSARGAELLAGVELEQLERLTLDVHGCSADALTSFLRTIRAPALGHLELRGGRLDVAMFRALGRLPLAPRLGSLGLTQLGLDDRAMRGLAAERAPFEALERLDVSHNELSREGLETARALAPEVISRRQNRPGTAAHERLRRFAGSRLRVAEEIADPKRWRDAGIDGELLWGRYRGTEDYELFVTRELDAYGCSCPSSYQPCKHVVALALVAEQGALERRPSGGIEQRVRQRTDYFDYFDDLGGEAE
jgi:uncharacterized protein (TIGR02996 family)